MDSPTFLMSHVVISAIAIGEKPWLHLRQCDSTKDHLQGHQAKGPEHLI